MLIRNLTRVKKWAVVLCSAGLLAALLPTRAAWSHTIADVLETPLRFDQQNITVEGQVANVVTRYGETVSTTFDLFGAKGEKLAILVSGVPQCKQGEICKVSGLFVARQNILLPQTVERVAERPFERAGVLFHQKSVGGAAAGGRGLREVYIPQE